MAQVPLSPTSVCSLQSDKLSGSESGSILSNVVYSDEHEKGSMVVSSHLSEDEDTSSCIDVRSVVQYVNCVYFVFIFED